MRTITNRKLWLLAAAGTALALSSTASAQTLINISGATLFENFFKAPASTNDFIDANGNGIAGSLGTGVEQLAPFGLPPAGGQYWTVHYRATGSGNGLAELVSFGQTFVTTADGVQLLSSNAENAYVNRSKFKDLTLGLTGPFNIGNPGACPVRCDTTTLIDTYSTPPNPSTGGIRIDLGISDVPMAWFVTTPGTPSFAATPATAGYGLNPRKSLNKLGGTSGANQGNQLKSLGGLNLFDPANPGAANANTVFDTQIAMVAVAAVSNLGTGLTQIDMNDLRYLSATGRLSTGENLMFVTRDSGSGTRNGFSSSLGLDPSYSVGENIGIKNDAPQYNILGPDFLPSNKGGAGSCENTIINHRLAIGHSGAERGGGSGYLLSGKAEVLAVKNDGGNVYARPNIDNVLDNGVNGYRICGPETFVTIGDAQAENAAHGGTSNGHPHMRNIQGAAYLNNITRSIAAFTALPGGDDTVFSPGEYLAGNFILVAASDYVQSPLAPTGWVPNPGLNQTLQNFTRTVNVLKNPAFYTFGTVTLNGKVPTRTTGTVYTDGVANGDNYLSQGGANISYGGNLTSRNRISGDFNGDGARDIFDSDDLIAAWRQRNGGPTWAAPTGTGPIAGAPGTDAIIEVLGDFNGDGNFNAADVRYWTDGLAKDPACNNTINRYHGFIAVDTSFGGNFFGTTKATGQPYNFGDSVADVAGSSGLQTPGFAPIGADGVINGYDIDYVYKQFRQNPAVTDGSLDWDNLAEAISGDFSADINGDGAVNQKDVCFMLALLGTSMGDVNLDGVVDGLDAAIATSHLNQAGGWAQGDVDGDGTVSANDLDVIAGAFNICCPADFNGDGFIDPLDYNGYINAFESGACNADFNGDGFLDPLDYNGFINAFEAGC